MSMTSFLRVRWWQVNIAKTPWGHAHPRSTVRDWASLPHPGRFFCYMRVDVLTLHIAFQHLKNIFTETSVMLRTVDGFQRFQDVLSIFIFRTLFWTKSRWTTVDICRWCFLENYIVTIVTCNFRLNKSHDPSSANRRSQILRHRKQRNCWGGWCKDRNKWGFINISRKDKN